MTTSTVSASFGSRDVALRRFRVRISGSFLGYGLLLALLSFALVRRVRPHA